MSPAAPKEVFTVVNAEYLASGDNLPSYDLPEFAFAGRSNVGKSSLLNALIQRRGLVRTSKHPGATRKVNLFRAELKDHGAFCFADLPGYGFANRSKTERSEWKESLERYLMERKDLCGVLSLVDARRGPEEEELELLEFLQQREGLATIHVITKLDKLPKSAQKPALAEITKRLGGRAVGTSAETGEGVPTIWRWMIRQSASTEDDASDEGVDTSET